MFKRFIHRVVLLITAPFAFMLAIGEGKSCRIYMWKDLIHKLKSGDVDGRRKNKGEPILTGGLFCERVLYLITVPLA